VVLEGIPVGHMTLLARQDDIMLAECGPTECAGPGVAAPVHH
jgi:hypothetical protein